MINFNNIVLLQRRAKSEFNQIDSTVILSANECSSKVNNAIKYKKYDFLGNNITIKFIVKFKKSRYKYSKMMCHTCLQLDYVCN